MKVFTIFFMLFLLLCSQGFTLDYYYGKGIGFTLPEGFNSFESLSPEVKSYLQEELSSDQDLWSNRIALMKNQSFVIFSKKPLLESKLVFEMEVLEYPLYRRPDLKSLQKMLFKRLSQVTQKRSFDSLNDISSQSLYFDGFAGLLVKSIIMKRSQEYVSYMALVPCGERSIFISIVSEKSNSQEIEKNYHILAQSFMGFAYAEEQINSSFMLIQLIFLSLFFLFYKLK